MTNKYTLKEPLRVVDIASQYHGMWFVETKENSFCYLSNKQKIVNCVDDDTVMDDLYFPSKHAAYACCAGYNANNVPVEAVTGDVMEPQVMEF